MLRAHLGTQGVRLVCCPRARSGKVSAKQRKRRQRRAQGWLVLVGPLQGCTLHPPACMGAEPGLSVMEKWMGEEERVSAPCPPGVGADPEASRFLGSPLFQSPTLGSPEGGTVPPGPCWYRNRHLAKPLLRPLALSPGSL